MQSREGGCENSVKQKSCLLCPIWTNLVNKDRPILTRLVDFIAVLVKNASRFLKLSSPLTRKQLKQRYVLSNFSGCAIWPGNKVGVLKILQVRGRLNFHCVKGKNPLGRFHWVTEGYGRQQSEVTIL